VIYIEKQRLIMDNKTKLGEFADEVFRIFQNSNGTTFKKFKADEFRDLIKNKDYDGIIIFLENIKKRYEGLSAKFTRRLERYDKDYSESFKKGVEIIKLAKKEEIEKLIEKLKKLKNEDMSNKKS